MKCVVLDLEFTDLIAEDVPLENSNLQIACAATLLSDSPGPPLLWTPKDDVHAMPMDLLVHLIAQLETMVSMGYMLVTWGGMGSDFRMLCKECPTLRNSVRNLALSSIDIPFITASIHGMMMSLGACAEGFRFESKLEGSSKEVPSLWKANQRKLVHQHVSLDVRLTMDVFQEICREGIVKWKTQRGFIRTVKMEYFPVKQCLQLPKPNVPFEMKQSMDPKHQAQWLYFE